MANSIVALRPGAAEDLDFICRLHWEAMGPHIAAALDPAEHDVPRRRVAERTDPATHEIVLLAGEAVGCRWVREHASELELELVRLWLLPRVQGRGLGTGLVEGLCDRADRAALPVRLRVMRRSPARRLYLRHGFEVVGDTETHFLMRREPTSGS